MDLIDCYRALAALLVVAFHATGCVASDKYFGVDPLAGWLAFGGRGVDLFFVLSGFIITFVHWSELGRSASISTYFIKRLIRIYPTLWCVSVPFLVAGAFMGTTITVGNWGEQIQLIVGSVFLLPTYVLPQPIVVWTLRHEILFYLLFGLVLWRPLAGSLLLVLWGAACVFHATSSLGGHFLTDFLFSTYHLEFLMGIVCGGVLRTRRIPVPSAFVAAGTVLFAAAGLPHAGTGLPSVTPPWVASNSSLQEVLLFGGSAMLMILGLAELDRGRVIAPPGFLISLGAASYSIYLIHYPVISLTCKALKQLEPTVAVGPISSLGLSVLASIIAGCLLHRLVERPLLTYGRSCILPRISPSVRMNSSTEIPACRAA